jgi:hypothetical protein
MVQRLHRPRRRRAKKGAEPPPTATGARVLLHERASGPACMAAPSQRTVWQGVGRIAPLRSWLPRTYAERSASRTRRASARPPCQQAVLPAEKTAAGPAGLAAVCCGRVCAEGGRPLRQSGCHAALSVIKTSGLGDSPPPLSTIQQSRSSADGLLLREGKTRAPEPGLAGGTSGLAGTWRGGPHGTMRAAEGGRLRPRCSCPGLHGPRAPWSPLPSQALVDVRRAAGRARAAHVTPARAASRRSCCCLSRGPWPWPRAPVF